MKLAIIIFGVLVCGNSLAANLTLESQILTKVEELRELTSSLKKMDLENSAGPVVAVAANKALYSLSYQYGDSSGLVAKFCHPRHSSEHKIEGSTQCREVNSSHYFRVFDSIKGIERRNIIADYDIVLSPETIKQVFASMYYAPYSFSRSTLMHLGASVYSYKTTLGSAEGSVSNYDLTWKVSDPKSTFSRVTYSCRASVNLQTLDNGQTKTVIGYSSCMIE